MAAKILIVDDDLQVIEMVGMVLHKQGYETVGAQSGAVALEKVASERPSLVLLDINMPAMDGYEVCRRLRSTPGTTEMPVIMFTACDALDDKLAGFGAGADDFITKPVHPIELTHRVQAVLLRSQRRAPESAKRARVVGFVGCKGGVGTTTVAVNVAWGLANKGEVVIADLARGAGSVALELGIRREGGLGRLLLQPGPDLTQHMVETELSELSGGLKVLPGKTEPEGSGEIADEAQMHSLLHHLPTLCDWLVLDLGTGVDDITRDALEVCDHVLVVVDPSPIARTLAVGLLEVLATEVEVARESLSVVVAHRVQAPAQGGSVIDITKDLGIPVGGTVPPAPELAMIASSRGVPMIEGHPASAAAQQLRELAAYVERL